MGPLFTGSLRPFAGAAVPCGRGVAHVEWPPGEKVCVLHFQYFSRVFLVDLIFVT